MTVVKCDVKECKYCVKDICTIDILEMSDNPDYFGDGPHNIVGLAQCLDIVDKRWDSLSEDAKKEYFELKEEYRKNGRKYMEDKYGKGIGAKMSLSDLK